jgi:hypothetical protein
MQTEVKSFGTRSGGVWAALLIFAAVAGPIGRAVALVLMGLWLLVPGSKLAVNHDGRADAWSEYMLSRHGSNGGAASDVHVSYSSLSFCAYGACSAVGGMLAVGIGLYQVGGHNAVTMAWILLFGGLFFVACVVTVLGQMFMNMWQ